MDLGDRRLRCRLIVVAALATGCSIGERNIATLQLDIDGAPLIDTDLIRVCIEDTLIHETALGDGRLAIGGLPTDSPVRVVISQLDESSTSWGATNSMTLDQHQPWAVTSWIECETGCTPCSIGRAQTNNTRNNNGLLAIHFLD